MFATAVGCLGNRRQGVKVHSLLNSGRRNVFDIHQPQYCVLDVQFLGIGKPDFQMLNKFRHRRADLERHPRVIQDQSVSAQVSLIGMKARKGEEFKGPVVAAEAMSWSWAAKLSEPEESLA